MPDTVILSQYPLSRSYRRSLADVLGAEPTFVTVAELRQGSLLSLITRTQAIRADKLLIGMEDATSIGAMPIMRMIAAATRARRLYTVDPGLTQRGFSRLEIVGGGILFCAACVAGLASVWLSALRLKGLAKHERRVFERRELKGEIAYLNTNLWFGQKAGGSVGHISGVANALMAQGFGLHYLSVGGGLQIRDSAKFYELSPPKVFGLPFETNLIRFSGLFVKQATHILEGKDLAFLYQRLSVDNFAGPILSRRLNAPLVVEYNGSEVWVAANWGTGLTFARTALAAEEQTLRHASLIVTISDVLRDELLDRGVEPRRIVSYPNGIDPLIFDPSRFTAADTEALRATEDLPVDACVCTFVGTFGAWHGAETYATAIRKICVEQPALVERAGLKFLFVGDGLRLPEVKEILDHPACAKHVHFTGLVEQSRAPAYLAASDILVSPHVPNADGTRFFGSPTKLFEYMAMGKAIIASDLEQVGEVLRASEATQDGSKAEGDVAVLLPPGDVDALAQALLALAEDRPRRETLGRAARARALARYTWEKHVEAILNRLRELEGPEQDIPC